MGLLASAAFMFHVWLSALGDALLGNEVPLEQKIDGRKDDVDDILRRKSARNGVSIRQILSVS